MRAGTARALRVRLGLVAALALTMVACTKAGAPGAPLEPASEDTPAAASLAVVPGSVAPPLDARAQRVEATPAPPLLRPTPWAASPVLMPSAPLPPDVGALAVIVMDEASGAILHERDAHRRLAPASLTKIATAIVTLRDGVLEDRVTSDVDGWLMRGSSVMGLETGDELTVRDLLYGMMLPSGNDAALLLGRHLAGSDAAFIERINALATELGLRDTRFTTPSGLGRDNLSSAHDIALLARYAMSLPEFAEVVATRRQVVTASRTFDLYNGNDFLLAYPGADGVKNGFTFSAGNTLVASATREGHRVYVVLLNDERTVADAGALLDWAFAEHEWPAPDSVAR